MSVPRWTIGGEQKLTVDEDTEMTSKTTVITGKAVDVQ